MNRLTSVIISAALLLAGVAYLGAQVVPTAGPPMGIACAFNSSPPTIPSGQAAWVQCDSTGALLTAAGAAGPSSSNITQVGGDPVPGAGVDNDGNSEPGIPTYSRNMVFDGTAWDRWRSIEGAVVAGTGTAAIAYAPTSAAAGAITPVVTAAAANNLVLKASAGNLYSVYATNQTATAGFLMVLNATTAPSDGAVTPIECVTLPASGNAAISYNPGPAARFATGITAVVSSGANCFTKTTGVITAFIKGMSQ